MRPGILTVVDCLGFKGIWTRHKPEDVLRDLKRLQEVVTGHERIGRQTVEASRIKISTRFLSDTFCIAVWFDDWSADVSHPDTDLAPLIGIAAKLTSNLIVCAAEE